ncbi:hypothetical protein R6Q59_035703 [Mikania micrantha]
MLEELKHEGDVSVKKTNTTEKRIDLTKIDGLATDHIEDQRREKVKDAMVHAWTSYEKYAWGHDELQAKDIADRLLPAWNTPSGILYNFINLVHGNAHNPGWSGVDSILADSGTEQPEFIAPTQRTRDPKYQQLEGM